MNEEADLDVYGEELARLIDNGTLQVEYAGAPSSYHHNNSHHHNNQNSQSNCNQQPIKFTGPNTPLEMTFTGLTRATANSPIMVGSDSVNAIALDPEPQNHFDRLMVAAHVQHSGGESAGGSHTISNVPGGGFAGSNGVVLQNTTLLPHVPGMPLLIMLLFAPCVELECDPWQMRYTSALCGLGCDTHARAVLPGNDLQLSAEVRLDNVDMRLIHSVRSLLHIYFNKALDSAFTEQQERNASKARECLFRLFDRRRDYTNRMEPQAAFRWRIDDWPAERIVPRDGMLTVQFFPMDWNKNLDNSVPNDMQYLSRVANYTKNCEQMLKFKLSENQRNFELNTVAICECCDRAESDNQSLSWQHYLQSSMDPSGGRIRRQKGAVFFLRSELSDHLASRTHKQIMFEHNIC